MTTPEDAVTAALSLPTAAPVESSSVTVTPVLESLATTLFHASRRLTTGAGVMVARVLTVEGCWVITIATAAPAATFIDWLTVRLLRLAGVLIAKASV